MAFIRHNPAGIYDTFLVPQPHKHFLAVLKRRMRLLLDIQIDGGCYLAQKDMAKDTVEEVK